MLAYACSSLVPSSPYPWQLGLWLSLGRYNAFSLDLRTIPDCMLQEVIKLEAPEGDKTLRFSIVEYGTINTSTGSTSHPPTRSSHPHYSHFRAHLRAVKKERRAYQPHLRLPYRLSLSMTHICQDAASRPCPCVPVSVSLSLAMSQPDNTRLDQGYGVPALSV